MDTAFHERSYQRHAAHYDGERPAWMDLGTVDAWRHERMYSTLLPLLRGQRWLTVGDGRYGSDANFLQRHGCKATASDISPALLPSAKAAGFISDFSVENAEALSFGSGSHDFVLCKESYHHFPRPALALYEMLRVARQGVCLLEPNDLYTGQGIVKPAIRAAMNLAKRALGREGSRHQYEESGNYLYSLSRREVEKVALGVNLPCVAFTATNDGFAPGVELEQMADNGPLQAKVKRTIAIKDALCALGLLEPGLLVAVLFKQAPDEEMRAKMRREGFEVVDLPRNPYL